MARYGRRAAQLVAIGGLVVCLALAGARPANAITAEEKARLDKGAKETLEELDQLLGEESTNQRVSCAMGRAPGWVAQVRAREPEITSLKASGMCVAGLTARGKEGRLSELYRDLLVQLGGDVAGAVRWPRAIGVAALENKDTVAIGNDKTIDLKPALAFDAGFTVAYQEGSASQTQGADPVQLQALAEACLGQHQDVGTCFSAGYLYGAAAVRGKTLLAR